MNRTLSALVAGVAVAFAVSSVTLAADVADPVAGTWALNVAKSKFSAGHELKSQTRTYKESADGINLVTESTAADGTSSTTESTFKYDGKDYAVTGSKEYDMIAVTRINAHSVKSVQKKDGKTVGSLTRTVSADGKTLTLKGKGPAPQGPFTLVLDKQ